MFKRAKLGKSKDAELTPEEMEHKLALRRKAKKLLYVLVPTLGVVFYLLGVAAYQGTTTNFLSWNPFG